ncbi:hypothetical protein BD770DRAFT_406724 [Pilaira anomala]|nr:hypothetical protein BD770DRAFT_406724 [Pilaira anomala]
MARIFRTKKFFAVICIGGIENQTVENYFKAFIFGSIDPRSHDTGSVGFMLMPFDFRSSTNSSLFVIDKTLSFNRYNMGKSSYKKWCYFVGNFEGKFELLDGKDKRFRDRGIFLGFPPGVRVGNPVPIKFICCHGNFLCSKGRNSCKGSIFSIF